MGENIALSIDLVCAGHRREEFYFRATYRVEFWVEEADQALVLSVTELVLDALIQSHRTAVKHLTLALKDW